MGTTPALNFSDLLQAPLEEHNPLINVLQELEDGVLICDRAGAILWHNNSLRHFFDLPETIVNHQYRDVISDELLHISIDSVLLSGKPVAQELQFQSHNITKTYQIHLAPLALATSRDYEQASSGCVAIFH